MTLDALRARLQRIKERAQLRCDTCYWCWGGQCSNKKSAVYGVQPRFNEMVRGQLACPYYKAGKA